MGIKVSIDIEGAEAAAAALNQYAAEAVEKLSRGVALGGGIVEGEAKALAPVSTEQTRPGGPHGQLRASITASPQGTQCPVGTNVEYAIYQEFGTYKMAAHPFLVPGLKNKEQEVIDVIAAQFR